MIGNLQKLVIVKNQVILDSSSLRSLANLQEGLEWVTQRVKSFITSVSAEATSIVVSADINPVTAGSQPNHLVSRQVKPVAEETFVALHDLMEMFEELSETSMLVLHLEIRCHCFYFLGRATRESSYVCPADAVEVDPQVPLLAKDLRDVEDTVHQTLSPRKVRYMFDGIGFLISQILITSVSHIKKVNRNGVKKMCQNIFTIQQELANIAQPRESALDLARQYFEMFYLNGDEILKLVLEQGRVFKESEYMAALDLLSRCAVTMDKSLLDIRKNKLRQILREQETKK